MKFIKWINLRWWIIKLWFYRGIEVDKISTKKIWIPTIKSLTRKGYLVCSAFMEWIVIYTERSTEDEEAQQD